MTPPEPQPQEVALRPMIRREVIFGLMWAIPFGLLLTYLSADKLYHIRSGGTSRTFQKVEAVVPLGETGAKATAETEFQPWLYAWIWIEGMAIYVGLGVGIGMLVGWTKYRIRTSRSRRGPPREEAR
jgi:hypothetical protein